MTPLLVFVFMSLTAQGFPPLPSPTPWASPTPIAEVDSYVDEGGELLATAQAEQYTFEAEGESVQFNGNDVLMDIDTTESNMMFSYFKWIVSNGSESVFGSFAPIMIPMGILISLSFISLFVYFWENVIVTILKIVGFIINQIMRLFGR